MHRCYLHPSQLHLAQIQVHEAVIAGNQIDPVHGGSPDAVGAEGNGVGVAVRQPEDVGQCPLIGGSAEKFGTVALAVRIDQQHAGFVVPGKDRGHVDRGHGLCDAALQV